jgi:hypothetical protein
MVKALRQYCQIAKTDDLYGRNPDSSDGVLLAYGASTWQSHLYFQNLLIRIPIKDNKVTFGLRSQPFAASIFWPWALR